ARAGLGVRLVRDLVDWILVQAPRRGAAAHAALSGGVSTLPAEGPRVDSLRLLDTNDSPFESARDHRLARIQRRSDRAVLLEPAGSPPLDRRPGPLGAGSSSRPSDTDEQVDRARSPIERAPIPSRRTFSQLQGAHRSRVGRDRGGAQAGAARAWAPGR